MRLNCCCLPVTCGLASLQIRKIQGLQEAKDYSAHHSEAAVITPSIVLMIINCLQLQHDYVQLTDYIGHHRDYRAAGLRSRVEIMAKVSISNSRQCRLVSTLRCHGMPRFPNRSINVILGQCFGDFLSLKNGWTLVL